MEEKLLVAMAEVLEVDRSALALDSPFKTAEFDFDSLKGYAMLLMLEEDFGVSVGLDDFIAAERPSDLLALIKAGGGK